MAKKSPSEISETKTPRPPIVVVMGHIDHGKSTLLDYIRKTNIVEGESGGITQHLSAYEARHKSDGIDRTITFLDTPGHAAFSAMRNRGATIADVAILVVSAEDGFKAQTKEALECITSAGIPYIVAINKIDKPNANVEKTKRELGEHEIYLEGLGGDVPFVPISAKTGAGIPELLDIILLTADLKEAVGNRNKLAEGVVIESKTDPKRGITATVIITDGTLETGMYVAAGTVTTPVRAITDAAGSLQASLSFSAPALLSGWSDIPQVGSVFQAYKTKRDAEKATKEEAAREAGKELFGSPDAEVVIPLVIKSDVAGTLEAIEEGLKKLASEKVALKIIQHGVGNITENDVKLAAGFNNALILGFHVTPDAKATSLLETATSVSVSTFSVIYELIEYVEGEVKKRTPTETVEEVTGRAKIVRVFSIQKEKQVIGGKVTSGSLRKGGTVNIVRRDNPIGKGVILELQQQKTSADEVQEGFDFGMKLESRIEIAEGDALEAVTMVTR